jgi:hypothetical protein
MVAVVVVFADVASSGRPMLWATLLLLLPQRYVESGQPHILNTTRPVVALHKDRSMFPLSLCVARLSGVGTDTLFIGVMRHEPIAGTSEAQIVKVSHVKVVCPSTAGCILALLHFTNSL